MKILNIIFITLAIKNHNFWDCDENNRRFQFFHVIVKEDLWVDVVMNDCILIEPLNTKTALIKEEL